MEKDEVSDNFTAITLCKLYGYVYVPPEESANQQRQRIRLFLVLEYGKKLANTKSYYW